MSTAGSRSRGECRNLQETSVQAYLTRHERNCALPTHRHRQAYAALVIDGSHVEASADGPFDCTPGTLVIHPAFHAHGNHFGSSGARVVNVPLRSEDLGGMARALQVDNLREARHVMERRRNQIARIVATARPARRLALPAWQEAFIEALLGGDDPIGVIARIVGVSAAHASRAVSRSHGMSPQLLRREWRWRQAMRRIGAGGRLADIAADFGFSDQSHLTRTTNALTGRTPSAWRRQIKCVQDAGNRSVAQYPE
jgi:AraC family transcriptional regulator